MFDLGPATTQLTRIVTTVRDDQLEDATPCAESRVRDLIDHVDGLALAFTAAAAKTPLPGGTPQVDGTRIGTDWRERIPDRLDALAAAWREPAAWEGMTKAGSLDMPAEAAARVALDEVIVHGWDLAVATGQHYDCAEDLVREALDFVAPAVEQKPDGVPGLFGPAVKVPGEASTLDQLLGLTGRDPSWTPSNG
jgi:uncharacterized protein (TIGR03086 family)